MRAACRWHHAGGLHLRAVARGKEVQARCAGLPGHCTGSSANGPHAGSGCVVRQPSGTQHLQRLHELITDEVPGAAPTVFGACLCAERAICSKPYGGGARRFGRLYDLEAVGSQRSCAPGDAHCRAHWTIRPAVHDVYGHQQPLNSISCSLGLFVRPASVF